MTFKDVLYLCRLSKVLGVVRRDMIDGSLVLKLKCEVDNLS